MAKQRTLNTDAVVRRAVELVNEMGTPDGLTLAQLAASLDVKTPSLYNHISGLDGLRQQVRIYTWRRLARELRHGLAGHTGRKALIFAAYAYRSFARDNPGIYHLLVQPALQSEDPEVVEAAEDILSTLLLIFASAGLEGDPALHAVRGFRSLLHGFVSLETSGGFGLPLEVETSFSRAVDAYVDGVLGRTPAIGKE